MKSTKYLSSLSKNPTKNTVLPSVYGSVVSFPTTLQGYIQKINNYPMLTEQEEKNYAYDWIHNHNYKSANQLVLSYLRLVVKIAMGYRGYGLPIMDVISEGNVGLLEAIKRFDLSKKVRLSTYAMWWIKAQIHEYILSMWSIVKINRNNTDKKLFFNLRKLKKSLGIEQQQPLLTYKNAQTLSKELGIDSTSISRMDQILQEPGTSLNAKIQDSQNEIGDTLMDKGTPLDVEIIQKHDNKWRHALLEEAIQQLSDREQNIFKNRLLASEIKTLDTLSKEHHVSIERIRQIEKRAYEKIQSFIQKKAKEKGYYT